MAFRIGDAVIILDNEDTRGSEARHGVTLVGRAYTITGFSSTGRAKGVLEPDGSRVAVRVNNLRKAKTDGS